MQERIKIWTLNAAEKLISDPKELLSEFNYTKKDGARGVDQAVFSWDEIEAGDRKKYEEPFQVKNENKIKKYLLQQNNKPHNLMPDIEYFIPIPAKCIGSYFDRVKEYPLLEPIRDYYYDLWKISYPTTNLDYKIFWQESNFSKMTTKNYYGYY